jgi:UDP-glucuronate decarboxylase
MAVNDGRVVSNFILQALQHKPITIFGKGEQTRTFCYVSDLIEGSVRMMEQNDFIGPVNLGSPVEITIRELAEEVMRLTDSRSKMVFSELPEDDPIRRRPDITLANERLDWVPKVSLEDGLEETIAYFRGKLGL